MKKLSILLLTGTLLCLSGGCDSYRNRDTRIAISYLCVGQDDMFELYDITATYSDGKGRVHTSPVTSFPWKVEYSYIRWESMRNSKSIFNRNLISSEKRVIP